MSFFDKLTGVQREREQRQHAEKARQMAEEEAKREKNAREKAEQVILKAEKQTEAEKRMREIAQKERSEAEVLANEEKQGKEKALQEKEEAEKRAKNEKQIKEKAVQEKNKAENRAKEEREIRERAVQEAETRAEKEKKLKEKALQEKSEAEERAAYEKKIREKTLQEKLDAEKQAANNETERQKAFREKLEAEKLVENERKIKEIALQDRLLSDKRAENEKANKEKALQEKVEAEKRVENEKSIKEKAIHDKLEAEKRAENEKIFKENALKEKLAAEKIAESLTKKTMLLKEDQEAIDKERQDLLNEKNERERLETESMRFNWGPKREPEWTEKEVERLQKHVTQHLEDSEGNPISLRFLVFGPTGHGKSSFSNGCRSAIEGLKKPTTYHQVASTIGGSHTRGFHGAQYGNHWIIDMAGIYESNRIDSMNIEDIASGKVPFYAELTDTLEMKEKKSMKIPEAGENDVACVVIVMKHGTELPKELRRQLEVILALGGKGVISYHLVLTYLDTCDPQFKDTDNIPNLYQSPKVQEAVKKISEETGIPPYAISFVKNYTTELETDMYTALLHLRVFENVVFSAVEQAKKLSAGKRQRELYTKTTQRKKTTALKHGGKSGDLEQKNSSKERNAAAKEQKKDDPGINGIEFMIFVVVLLFAILFIYFKFHGFSSIDNSKWLN